jgi:hypothetical protein
MEFAECDDAKASQMSQAIINTASEALLKDAKAASERRGSMVIREVDVNFAISRFKMLKAHKWYLIPVSGNGACQCTLPFPLPHVHFLKISNPSVPLQLLRFGCAWSFRIS